MTTRFATTLRFGCALSCLASSACWTAPDAPSSEVDGREQAIVDVPQTAVERQTIGNCWVYACSAWAESLHQKAATDTLDVSESYWTYMHWFLQITSRSGASITEIATGGSFRELQRIVSAYGLMRERDFLAADSDDERAFSQSDALIRMNAALASGGALARPEDRADFTKVRQVLDDAWRLSVAVRTQLSTAFGVDMSRTFARGATATGTPVMSASAISAGYGGRTDRTLANAFAEWREIGYSSWSARETLRRVQRALHAREPVVMSWLVDFNALESRWGHPLYGSFNLQTLEGSGAPGRQGGHMTVLEDYQARLHGELATTVSEVSLQTQVAKGAFDMVRVADAPSVRVEAGQALRVAMTGDGDADLYVQTGQAPSARSYVCRPYASNSAESCSVAGPADVFVAVSGYRAASVQLTFTTQAITETEQLLAAGDTLDPTDPDDAALLRAALNDSTEIEFLRIKNSWGANRQGLAMVQGFERGYHDLYLDYLNGPIAEPDTCQGGFQQSTCARQATPLRLFLVPPGY